MNSVPHADRIRQALERKLELKRERALSARPVTIILRCGTPAWPNDTRVLGEGRTLAAALKAARRALSSYEPAPGDVYVSRPIGAGFDRHVSPLILA